MQEYELRILVELSVFSDDPEALSRGFSKMENTLKALHLRRVFLWPRFRVEVACALSHGPEKTDRTVQVEEISVRLTPAMRTIQEQVVALMDVCLSDLKRSNAALSARSSSSSSSSSGGGGGGYSSLDASELTVENALSRSFDYLLQKQLDAEWHRIGAQTKGLMQDMRTLRRLLEHLVRMDCATFYLLLLQLKSAASAQAVKPAWLMSSPADTLFRTAKERVYKITSGAGAAAKRGGKNSAAGAGATSSTSSSSSQKSAAASEKSVELVLEVNPKWLVVREILEDIGRVLQNKKKGKRQQKDGSSKSGGNF